jgi:hypothetical protein
MIFLFFFQADKNGITTFYHHLMFSTLELSAITNLTGLKMNCNITGLQMFEPNNLKINALIAGLNLKRKFEKKPFLNYAPVSYLKFLC